MTTGTKKRGIVDPWRVTTPLVQPPPPPPRAKHEKIDISQVDRDEDLRAKRSCVIRGKHASIEVNNRNVTSEHDALRDLVQCLFEVLELEDGPNLFDEQRIGLRFGERVYELPPPGTTNHSVLATGAGGASATIWFHEQDLDQGLLRLVRLLRTVQRRPGIEGETLLKRWGVTPMLR